MRGGVWSGAYDPFKATLRSSFDGIPSFCVPHASSSERVGENIPQLLWKNTRIWPASTASDCARSLPRILTSKSRLLRNCFCVNLWAKHLDSLWCDSGNPSSRIQFLASVNSLITRQCCCWQEPRIGTDLEVDIYSAWCKWHCCKTPLTQPFDIYRERCLETTRKSLWNSKVFNKDTSQ